MNTAKLPFPLPASLICFGESEQGRAWLAELPLLLHEAAEEWQLELGEPFPEASASLTLPALLRDGSEAVLKLQFPHREAEQEAAALAAWNGDGAVRLLAQDPARHALLVERCRPGTPLSDLDQDAALDIVVELLPRLLQTTDRPVTPLADEAEHWAQTLPCIWECAGRPFERALLDAALGAIDELVPTQGEQVLLHQDLHAGNVLRAEREPWLRSIRSRCSASASSASHRSFAAPKLGHSREHVLHRLDRLSSQLALDRHRVAGWAFVQTLAWSIEDTFVWAEMIEIASWLRDAWASDRRSQR